MLLLLADIRADNEPGCMPSSVVDVETCNRMAVDEQEFVRGPFRVA
jgi:hypothetical protein